MQSIALNEITLRDDFRIRDHVEEWKVEEYASIFDRLPPILVARSNGNLWLIDGFHRIEAARRMGHAEIAAEVVEADENAAYEMAVKANTRNGLPLKTKEKKAAARGFLLRFTERADNWIAEDCGLNHETVTSLRRMMESTCDIRHISPLIGRDGRERKCDCERCNPQPTQKQEATPAPTNPTTIGPVTIWQGLSKNTVAALRDEMESTPHIEGLDKLMGRDGAIRPRQITPRSPAPPESEPVPVNPTTIGPVTIWQGDARELAGVLTEPVHLVVTSPPYNVGISYGDHDDNMPDEEYFTLLRAVWAQCCAVMAEGARIAVVVPFGVGRNPWVPLAARISNTLTDSGFTLRGQIVWDKGTSGGRTTWGSFRLPTNPSLRDTTEAIIVAHKGSPDLAMPADLIGHDSEGSFSPLLSNQADFMELAQDHWLVPPESAQRVKHPAPFPVPLIERLIRFYAYPGARILDPFAGSGTAGVAALNLGCAAFLCDKDSQYCELMKRRIHEFSTRSS